jgi:hypothetical protein
VITIQRWRRRHSPNKKEDLSWESRNRRSRKISRRILLFYRAELVRWANTAWAKTTALTISTANCQGKSLSRWRTTISRAVKATSQSQFTINTCKTNRIRISICRNNKSNCYLIIDQVLISIWMEMMTVISIIRHPIQFMWTMNQAVVDPKVVVQAAQFKALRKSIYWRVSN